MISSNSIQLFTLMLLITMGGLKLCLANPVNKEDKLANNKDLPIKLKERLFNVTSKDSGVLERSGATFIEEEESKKKASWETARCFLDSRSLFLAWTFLFLSSKRREKLYALILSLVLGIFGADWFYLCVTRSIFNFDILGWHDYKGPEMMTKMSITKMIWIISARPTSWLGWSSWWLVELEGSSVVALLAPVLTVTSETSMWT